MTFSTAPAAARTDVLESPHTAPRATAVGVRRTTIRAAGLALAVGTLSWATANAVFGFSPDSEVGVKAGDLTGFLFQCGVMVLLHLQMATRATGTKKINLRMLQVERVLLSLAMLWSLLHAFLPSQRGEVWLGVLDAFWPLSMLGMFLIGIKIAVRGRWRGAARAWSLVAETWAVATVPVYILGGEGPGDVAGVVHLLLGYTVLGLIIAARPDLVEDRG